MTAAGKTQNRTTPETSSSALYLCGIDIGSTTVKLVVTTPDIQLPQPKPVFSAYHRHDMRICEVLVGMLADLRALVGNSSLSLSVTGSAGMGISERCKIPFVQEVVAAAEMARRFYPHAHMLCDIGGEDSKLILFDDSHRPDFRMNDACAGGTGAYIDQMATLLNRSVSELGALAETHSRIYPIASRCGVFAKTDVQNLLSQGVPHSDIAASILQSVAAQVVNTLMRAASPQPQILMTGGPLTFIPFLRKALLEKLGLSQDNSIVPDESALFSAFGAALTPSGSYTVELDALIADLQKDNSSRSATREAKTSLPPLFASPEAYHAWRRTRFNVVSKISPSQLDGRQCFIGVDSGSTTTKMTLMDSAGQIALSWYASHMGDHVGAVAKGLQFFRDSLAESGVHPEIVATAVTGYGEELIRTAFNFDIGVVESIAHFRAAREIARNVSFVLDIGGQDMKAIFADQEAIRKVEINEACSSGCGSFLENFAEVMDLSMEAFAKQACVARAPFDLGSRCTVFMNSRIKQALKQNAPIGDVAAGLAYSVVRNCLTKVLKIRDISTLGGQIVVQGGAFLNPALQRAFEIITKQHVTCPDIAGLMGAYGCALYAHDHYERKSTSIYRLDQAVSVKELGRRRFSCHGCSNQCPINRLDFGNGRHFFTGNRCERTFSNSPQHQAHGFNGAAHSIKLLMDRPYNPAGAPRAKIGIPKVLNLFENLPFWTTLLVNLGFEVVVSEASSQASYERSIGTIMSGSICFPARITHAHIMDLISKKVDRIFYPRVMYDQLSYGSLNSYNCPIVTGYPDVIRSSIAPERAYGIPLDAPTATFKDRKLLENCLWTFLHDFGIALGEFKKSFKAALEAQRSFAEAQQAVAKEVIHNAERQGRRVVMILGRPYHLDPMINHDIPEMLATMGVDVLMANQAPDSGSLDDIRILTQWAYPNRILNACRYVAQFSNIDVLQINSFGCGPDAILIDEVSEILKQSGKTLTVIRVDEGTSRGSIRLRLRTMVETRLTQQGVIPCTKIRPVPARFMKADRSRKIIAPYMSPLLSLILKDEFGRQGYDIETLPPTDEESLNFGLRYVNNEICYPAILIIGDVLKALASGRYDRSTVAIGITQTGGQCRASNYAGLLEKALLAAGYNDVPVVSVHLAGGHLHDQPGFKLNWLKAIPSAFLSLTVADAIAMMYRAIAPRECQPGSAQTLSVQLVSDWLERPDRSESAAVHFIGNAVSKFKNLPSYERHCPRIGIVGEIYVKYGAFANQNLVGWLCKQGAEVFVPPLINLFVSGLVNNLADARSHVEDIWWRRLASRALIPKINSFMDAVNTELERFPYHIQFVHLDQIATEASQVIDLCNQAGEGWLLPGEIIQLAKHGIDSVICLQPFGCIANQVVAKGIEKRLREVCPSLNILFLDLDQNTSEVNMLNRIHFLLNSAAPLVPAVC
jgi:predicted CoA-substrate-specific enzyme activase